MIKYFYKVMYQKESDGGSFDLGIFSTKNNAKLKIDKSKKCKGFDDEKCFTIIKFGVDFSKDIEKSNIKLYSVAHEYSVEESGQMYDIYNVFDILGSKAEAEKRIEYIKNHSRIGRKYPGNFEVCETIVDNFAYWSEGYYSY